jgi:hypothetical protein
MTAYSDAWGATTPLNGVRVIAVPAKVGTVNGTVYVGPAVGLTETVTGVTYAAATGLLTNTTAGIETVRVTMFQEATSDGLGTEPSANSVDQAAL